MFSLSLFLAIDSNQRGFFTRRRIAFAFLSAATFLALGALMYVAYGSEFVEHTYTYHLGRRDVKHNFSVYYYLFYLECASVPSLVSMLAFAPQALLTLAATIRFRGDVDMSAFVQAWIFVAFNKVYTVQVSSLSSL